MATDIPRTTRDDVTDALTALDEAVREIMRWQAHLARAQGEPTVPVVLQARRSAGIVLALVGEAHAWTRAAACGAEEPANALPA